MNEVAGPFTTPGVNGSWDGWCGGCTPLSDPDGDGIWSTTKMLEPGYYEYISLHTTAGLVMSL